MIKYLQDNFKPDSHQQGYSLAIVGGRNGARLTHNHAVSGLVCVALALILVAAALANRCSTRTACSR